MMAEERKLKKQRAKDYKKYSKAIAKDAEFQKTLEVARAGRREISTIKGEIKDLNARKEEINKKKVELTQKYYDTNYPGGEDQNLKSMLVSYNTQAYRNAQKSYDKKLEKLDKQIQDAEERLAKAYEPKLEYNKKKAKG